jgi:molecular chaperone HtpG
MLGQDVPLPKRILEVNPRHVLLHNLAAMLNQHEQDTLFEVVAEQLYDSALLIEGIHPKPVDMVERIQKLMEAATRKA